MPRTKEKTKKPGRNDPCWCGSGKKYKDCHLSIDDTQRTELRKLYQAQDTLLPKIMEAAEQIPKAFPQAIDIFWRSKYTPAQMDGLNDLELRGAERFLTWFVFGHRLKDGRTLVETLAEAAEQGAFEVDEFEARLLRAWTGVRLRPYLVEEVKKGKGFLVRDLLNQEGYEVEEHAASRNILAEEVLIGHLVPVGLEQPDTPPETPPQDDDTAAIAPTPKIAPPTWYVVGAVARLTSDTRETITEFANLHLEDLRRTQPDASFDDLLRERSHIFNHFVMDLPEEHHPGTLDDILLKTRTMLHFSGLLPMGDSSSEEDEDQAAPEATVDREPDREQEKREPDAAPLE